MSTSCEAGRRCSYLPAGLLFSPSQSTSSPGRSTICCKESDVLSKASRRFIARSAVEGSAFGIVARANKTADPSTARWRALLRMIPFGRVGGHQGRSTLHKASTETTPKHVLTMRRFSSLTELRRCGDTARVMAEKSVIPGSPLRAWPISCKNAADANTIFHGFTVANASQKNAGFPRRVP
jgi:hypothetical protein